MGDAPAQGLELERVPVLWHCFCSQDGRCARSGIGTRSLIWRNICSSSVRMGDAPAQGLEHLGDARKGAKTDAMSGWEMRPLRDWNSVVLLQ